MPIQTDCSKMYSDSCLSTTPSPQLKVNAIVEAVPWVNVLAVNVVQVTVLNRTITAGSKGKDRDGSVNFPVLTVHVFIRSPFSKTGWSLCGNRDRIFHIYSISDSSTITVLVSGTAQRTWV